jgi:hypothetical protein
MAPTEETTAVRERLAWEVAADSILQLICRHPCVDRMKSTVIFDFITPVVAPSLMEVEPPAKKGAKPVQTEPAPMDLTTLLGRLEAFSIADAEEFYSMAVGVFENALRLTMAKESEMLQHLVKRLEQLITYVKWLCLELLPLSPTTTTTTSSSTGNLTYCCEGRMDANIKECATIQSSA